MDTAPDAPSSFPALDLKEATVIGELQAEQLTLPLVTDQVVDQIATSAVSQFLDSVDPTELEVRAAGLLGGLQGEDTLGSAVLKVLREMAELP